MHKDCTVATYRVLFSFIARRMIWHLGTQQSKDFLITFACLIFIVYESIVVPAAKMKRTK